MKEGKGTHSKSDVDHNADQGSAKSAECGQNRRGLPARGIVGLILVEIPFDELLVGGEMEGGSTEEGREVKEEGEELEGSWHGSYCILLPRGGKLLRG